MYNYSTKFQNALFYDKRKFKINIAMLLFDNTKLSITEADIWQGSMSIESATSGTGEFSVGSAVAAKLSFSLNNLKDIYSAYDFIDAKINLQIGMYLPDNTVELEQYGIYTVTDATFSQNTITITALDNLSKFSYSYIGDIPFPTTAEDMITRSCLACGVELDANSVPEFLKNYTIYNVIEAGNTTYSSMISYAAQLAGCFARANHEGKLEFGWYATGALSENYDGGTFKYDGKTDDDRDESQLDGGSFNYDDGDDVDGGTFNDFKSIHSINTTFTNEIATDNVLITGVKVTSSPKDSETPPDTTFIGEEGYVIEINQNPFIQAGQSAVVAQEIFNAVGGMLFRPLTASILPDPSIEAGDVGIIIHRGISYAAFLSNVKFCPDGDCTISCDAQSKNRHGSSTQGAVTQAIIEAKRWVAYEKSAREVALENMTMLLSNSLGYFSTTEEQAGGGKITYIHNKPLLEDSATRWMLSEQGFLVSTDFGKTWTAGFDASGNAVVNVLSAVGVNADWIHAGTITGVKYNNGNGTFRVTESGHLTASDADIVGNLNAGSSINCGKFTVTSDGLMKAENAEVTGDIKSGSTITCGDDFKVTKEGIMNAISATLSNCQIIDGSLNMSGKSDSDVVITISFGTDDKTTLAPGGLWVAAGGYQSHTSSFSFGAEGAGGSVLMRADNGTITASNNIYVGDTAVSLTGHTHRPAEIIFTGGHYVNQSVYDAIQDLNKRVTALGG